MTELNIPIEWVLSAVGVAFSGLLSWNLFNQNKLMTANNDRMLKIEQRQDKHSEINDVQTKEIAELKVITEGLEKFTEQQVQANLQQSEDMKGLRTDLREFNTALIKTVVEMAKQK